MDITALHFAFQDLGWQGVALFAEIIKRKSFGGVSMAWIRRTYEMDIDILDSSNDLYTVENYLSDLFSRRKRLSKENVADTNRTFANLAKVIRGTRQTHE